MTLRFLGNRGRITVSITMEHGVIKLLICRGLEVIDYRVLLANPRFFREGQVSNTARVAGLIQNALADLAGDFHHAIAAVPGFQNRLDLMQFPRAPGFNAENIIPQEASRVMKVSSETYQLSWHRLKDRLDRTRWLVMAASRRSITSLMDTAEKSEIAVTTLELRPFPLARAVNQPDAIIAWAAPDGCDVVITKESIPVEHQSQFWGADLVEDTVLVDRLTDIVGRTITTFNETSPEGPLSEDVPLVVCGSPIRRDPDISMRVANNLRRLPAELASPLIFPEDFPVNDLVINMGLALRDV